MKKIAIIGGSTLLLVIATAVVLTVKQPRAATAQVETNGQPKFVYAAKFVCGVMRPRPLGETPVKPANYATKINIHNPQWDWVPMYKKVVKAELEPEQGKPQGRHVFELGPDHATEADCNEFYKLLGIQPTLQNPRPYVNGFFVIESWAPLDVVGVYTASLPAPFAGTVSGLSIAEDVEYIPASQIDWSYQDPFPGEAAPPDPRE